MLAQPTLLRTLVPEQLRDGVPAYRLRKTSGAGSYHAGERRCHLGSECHFPSALIGESVQLSDDLLTRFPDIEIQWLERRAVVLDEAVPLRDRAPHRHDVLPERHLLRVEVAKSGQARKIHRGRKLRAHKGAVQ